MNQLNAEYPIWVTDLGLADANYAVKNTLKSEITVATVAEKAMEKWKA